MILSDSERRKIQALPLKNVTGKYKGNIDLNDFKLLVKSNVTIEGILAFLNIISGSRH